MKKEGVVYIATGKKYVEECYNSLRSLKEQSPELHVTLFTDKDNIGYLSNKFDQTIEIESPQYNFIDKIAPLLDSPYEKTLFLDSDTYVTEDISNLFTLLKRFDLAVSQAPGNDLFNIDNAPQYFPEYNTGVILYKRTDVLLDFFNDWLELYKRQMENSNPPHDQPSFREVLYKRPDISFFTLPNSYNFRTVSPNFLPRNSSIKILHGRLYNPSILFENIKKANKDGVLFINTFKNVSKTNLLSAEDKFNRSLFFKGIVKMLSTIAKVYSRIVTQKYEYEKRKGNS